MSPTENDRLLIISVLLCDSSVYLCEMSFSINFLVLIPTVILAARCLLKFVGMALAATILSRVCLQTGSIAGIIHGIK